MSGENENKRIVVIGGAGYIGSVLTGQLLDAGYQVDVFDALRFGDMGLSRYRDRVALRLIQGDIRDIRAMTACIKNAHGVVLLAALVGEPACDVDPDETVDINLIATKAVAEAARYYRIPRFVFASTDSVYGIREGIMKEDSEKNPISLYARLKLQAEEEIMGLHQDDFQPTVLRMATIYGLSPRMRFDLIINILTLHAVSKGEITIMGGKQWRPLVHVSDAARAYATALSAPLDKVGGQCFNVGSNEQNYQVGTLGELVKEVCPEITVNTIEQTPDLRDYYVSCDKIGEAMGYKVEKTIIDAVREIRDALQDGTIADPLASHHYNVAK
jgi:nucleoside-diphosphate-sugar epimerase